MPETSDWTEVRLTRSLPAGMLKNVRALVRRSVPVRIVRRGDLLFATLPGDDGAAELKVAAPALPGASVDFRCDCGGAPDGLCIHAAAVILMALRQPGIVETRPPLAELLKPLDREQLERLITHLAGSDLGTLDRIEALLSSVPVGPTAPAAPPPLDVVRFKREFKAALAAACRRADKATECEGSEILIELFREWAQKCSPYLEAGRTAEPLTILEVMVEELLDDPMRLSGGDAVELIILCHDLGKLFAEIFLTDSSWEPDRDRWLQRLARWGAECENYHDESPFAIAEDAIAQGWDHPPVVEILAGKRFTSLTWHPPGSDEARTDWDAELADARVNVLRRQGRWNDCIRLATAEGRYVRVAEALLRLGRAAEAAETALRHLSDVEETLEISQLLEEQGESELALRVVFEAANSTKSVRYRNGALLTRARELSERLGRSDVAVETAVALVCSQETMRLADVIAARELAGDRWPDYRERVLAQLATETPWLDSEAAAILLLEGLTFEAKELAESHPTMPLAEQVADALLETDPEWVYQMARARFDEIRVSRCRSLHEEGARWLDRAGQAAHRLGAPDDWLPYLHELLQRHKSNATFQPHILHWLEQA